MSYWTVNVDFLFLPSTLFGVTKACGDCENCETVLFTGQQTLQTLHSPKMSDVRFCKEISPRLKKLATHEASA